MTITKKEIVIFGKVLSELGRCIEKNPEILFEVFDRTNSTEKEDRRSPEISLLTEEQIKLAQDAKVFLSSYNIEDLKQFIKKQHYGIPSKPNKDKLIECIIRNISNVKRDVFMEYETMIEKEKE